MRATLYLPFERLAAGVPRVHRCSRANLKSQKVFPCFSENVFPLLFGHFEGSLFIRTIAVIFRNFGIVVEHCEV